MKTMIILILAGILYAGPGWKFLCENMVGDTLFIDTNSLKVEDERVHWIYKTQNWPKLRYGFLACDSTMHCYTGSKNGRKYLKLRWESIEEYMFLWVIKRPEIRDKFKVTFE